MRVREDAIAKVPAERAWSILADPGLHSLWNPRITRTTRMGFGPWGVGSRYRVQYDLGRGAVEFDAEIAEFRPPSLLVARLEERARPSGAEVRRRWVEERYELRPAGAHTYVLHEVVVHHSGVPWPLRALVWLIMRFGEPVGQTYMEKFAELAEGDLELAATGSARPR